MDKCSIIILISYQVLGRHSNIETKSNSCKAIDIF